MNRRIEARVASEVVCGGAADDAAACQAQKSVSSGMVITYRIRHVPTTTMFRWPSMAATRALARGKHTRTAVDAGQARVWAQGSYSEWNKMALRWRGDGATDGRLQRASGGWRNQRGSKLDFGVTRGMFGWKLVLGNRSRDEAAKE
jgi:hypothetical protein